jgi:Mrp family chromosome partitioning ATPase/capsular polysaccharide biosynthesis protein
MERNSGYGSPRWADDSRIDTRRYLGALKRNRRLIVVIVVVVTLLVLIVSLVLPKSYSATAKIIYDPESALLGPPDAESTQRQLSTLSTLFNSPQLEQAAAKQVPGETPESIHSAISITVATEANLLEVKASADEADKAAEIANAVSTSFLQLQQEQAREKLLATQASLEEQIENVGAESETAEAQVEALQNRINHLEVQAATAGGELQLGQEATAPSSATSPDPPRNTLIALVAAIFIAVLVALGRDQLSPGISDPREVGRLLRTSVLAMIPYVGKRASRKSATAAAIEHEAYQSLSASIQALRPADGRPRLLLLTSAVHGEGKSTASSRLGRALAQAGHKTLLVSGDVRWPELHNLFHAPRQPGMTDLLGEVNAGTDPQEALASMARLIDLPKVGGTKAASLHLLTAGTPTTDAATLLASGATSRFFEFLRGSDYDYVLVDGPPALGVADIQPLMAEADDVIAVVRLDRVNVADMVNLHEVFSRLVGDLFGVVVVGASVDASPYYLGEKRRVMLAGSTVGEDQPKTSKD